MKVNELRIGNLIMTCKPEFKGERDYVETKVSGAFIDYAENDKLLIKPIPITEEWLLKFGFEKAHAFYTKNKESDLEFIICDEGNGNFNPMFYKGKYIKYVHQLQNLYFALTSNELELD